MAKLAMSALDVPVVALTFKEQDTLWVAANDDQHDGAALSARLQESTLFERIATSAGHTIEDIWAEGRFTALVDLEQFEYRFFASVELTDVDGVAVGQLCVLDDEPRTRATRHVEILSTLVDMARHEMERRREAMRRRRGEALQDRVQRVLQMISRDEPAAVTLEALMFLVESQCSGYAATMHWLDPDGLLRPVAAPSVPDALVEATDGLLPDAEAGAIGASVHDGEEVIDAEITESIHWEGMRAAVETAGFTAMWSVPVSAGTGRAALGVVTLFSHASIRPTEEMRQTVEMAARLAAVVLERDHDRLVLQRTQARHRQMLAQSSEGLYRIELNPPVATDQSLEAQIQQVFERAHIAECNDVFARQHGFAAPGELLGRPLLDLYGEGQDLAQLPILRAIDHGYGLEDATSCEVDHQGREHWFLNRVQGILEDDALVSFWGAQRDVTKLQHTEYALRESDHRYHALADLTPNLVMVHDQDTLHSINSAGARLVGANDAEEIEGRALSDLLDDDGALERLLRNAKASERTGSASFEECELQCLDGTTRRVAIASSRILHRGHPAILSVARDVADHPPERRLRPAEVGSNGTHQQPDATTRLKSEFVANMNQEIRTPLTAIIGFAEILGDEVADLESVDVRELVDHIRSNGQRLLWTLDSILNLSRMEAGAMKLRPMPLDIVREMEHLVETFQVMAREKHIELEIHGEQQPVHASLDHMAFERVVGNLLANAIRDTEEGRVTLHAHDGTGGPTVVLEATAGDPILRDLPEATTETLIDALCEKRVGVAVVRSLLNVMGGNFEVEEHAEGGITYTAHFDSADEVTLQQAMRLLPEDAASAA